jgi:hypothetical protein
MQMTERNCSWESFKVEGTNLVEKIKEWIREGNVRRVVIEHDGRTLAEFPLTAGVVGAVFAPIAAAIGAVAALAKDCTIRVERYENSSAPAGPLDADRPRPN